MARVVEIKVDTNDGDYETQVTTIATYNEGAVRELLQRVMDLPTNSFRNWGGEYIESGHWVELGFNEDNSGDLENLFPSCEYGFHSLEHIKFYTISDEITLTRGNK